MGEALCAARASGSSPPTAARIEREETLKRAHRYFGDRGEAIFLSARQTALEHALSPIGTLRANLLAAIEHSAEVDPQSAAGAARFSPLVYPRSDQSRQRDLPRWRLRKTVWRRADVRSF